LTLGISVDAAVSALALAIVFVLTVVASQTAQAQRSAYSTPSPTYWTDQALAPA
jgi:hypothetical protein